VPGSASAVYDHDPNIEEFKENLVVALKSNPKIKYLGICFGMQLLCYAFGGKVTKAQSPSLLVEKVRLNMEVVARILMMQHCNERKELAITAFHGDEVINVPEHFEVIGQSSSCGVEMVISKNQRHLGIQGHPDFTAHFISHYRFNR